MTDDELRALAEAVKAAREKLYVLQCCDDETEEERSAQQVLEKAEEALAQATDEIAILALLDRLEAAEAEVVRAEDNVASLGFRIVELKCENARLARHYEELRQSTDGGSESMTHADACHVVEALEQQLAEVNAENARLQAVLARLMDEARAKHWRKQHYGALEDCQATDCIEAREALR